MKTQKSQNNQEIQENLQEECKNEKYDKWVFYKSGWRPALGWLSVLIVMYAFLIHPIIVWYVTIMGYKIAIPMIDSAAMLNLVGIVIGIGAMRTYEKIRARDRFTDRFNEAERPPFRGDIYNER